MSEIDVETEEVVVRCETCGSSGLLDPDDALFLGWKEELQDDGSTKFVMCPPCTGEYEEDGES